MQGIDDDVESSIPLVNLHQVMGPDSERGVRINGKATHKLKVFDSPLAVVTAFRILQKVG